MADLSTNIKRHKKSICNVIQSVKRNKKCNLQRIIKKKNNKISNIYKMLPISLIILVIASITIYLDIAIIKHKSRLISWLISNSALITITILIISCVLLGQVINYFTSDKKHKQNSNLPTKFAYIAFFAIAWIALGVLPYANKPNSYYYDVSVGLNLSIFIISFLMWRLRSIQIFPESTRHSYINSANHLRYHFFIFLTFIILILIVVNLTIGYKSLFAISKIARVMLSFILSLFGFDDIVEYIIPNIGRKPIEQLTNPFIKKIRNWEATYFDFPND